MGSIKRSVRIVFSMVMVATLVVMTAGVASAARPESKVVYNSVPKHVPGNVVSQAFQAQQTSEFGDSVTLAGSARRAFSADVVMSSWGCENGNWNLGDCVTTPGTTFSHPITLNLYSVGGSGEPDALLLTKTQTFAIPFRPSADAVNCPATPGKWYSAADNACYNGFATKIKFTLDDTRLPDNVIWTVAFNTSGYGAAPIGYQTTCALSTAGCGYDSLNVGAESFNGQPSKGIDVDPDAVLWAHNGGALLLDYGWTGYRPLATIRTR